MTYKEKSDFLEQVIQLDIIIENLIEKDAESLRRCCNTAAKPNGTGAQNGKGENSVENRITDYLKSKEDTKQIINAYIDRYVGAKKIVESAIAELDLEYHDIMILYYIKPKQVIDDEGECHKRRHTLDDIAHITFIDPAEICRKKQAAIDKIEIHNESQ